MPWRPQYCSVSDEELAVRAQADCVDSFEQLLLRYQVPVLNFLRRHLSRQDAEDVLQDTFVRAYESINRYRPEWRFASWLFTIARRLSVNHMRRSRPAPDSDVLDGVAGLEAEPGEILAKREQRQQLWDLARRALNERSVSALWLFYAEDMPIKEIARVLDSTPDSVKSTLSRARGKLKIAIEADQRRREHEAAGAGVSGSLLFQAARIR
jgi:RNA polymerase sigma-70 factor (ECF subfamily)